MVGSKVCNFCRTEKALQEFKLKFNSETCKNCIKCNLLAKMNAENCKCPYGSKKNVPGMRWSVDLFT